MRHHDSRGASTINVRSLHKFSSPNAFAVGDPVVFEADEQGQDGCQYKALWVQRLADT
jgi:hypothetical protein